MWIVRCLIFFLYLSVVASRKDDDDDENYDPYTTMDPAKREPSPCEVCKFFVNELQMRLDKTAKSKEVLELGQGLDSRNKKKIIYHTSELRLTEALHEPHICENILKYNVHAERKGSNRYAKGRSETMSTLHGLVNKGVKVELGIPFELWDKPASEVSKMHRMCFLMAEKHEDDIEDWYYNHQNTHDLSDYICRDRYLRSKGSSADCLSENWVPPAKGEEDDEDPEAKKPDTPKPKKKKKKKGGKKKGEFGSTPLEEAHDEL